MLWRHCLDNAFHLSYPTSSSHQNWPSYARVLPTTPFRSTVDETAPKERQTTAQSQYTTEPARQKTIHIFMRVAKLNQLLCSARLPDCGNRTNTGMYNQRAPVCEACQTRILTHKLSLRHSHKGNQQNTRKKNTDPFTAAKTTPHLKATRLSPKKVGAILKRGVNSTAGRMHIPPHASF